jgi:thioesterase domain-containing protein
VEDLASDYVGEIIKQQTASPIHLAGFSSGSVLAFEMARQLTRRGVPVGLLALIDGGVQAEDVLLPKRVKYTKMAVRKLCKIVFKLRDEVADGPKQFIMKRWRHLSLTLRIRAFENSTFRGQISMEEALLLAERSYKGEPYSGSALLIRFHDEASKFGPDPFMGWSGLVQGGLEVIDLDGGHITGMSPLRAPAIAMLLSGHMEAREAACLAQAARG